jgi:3-oxoacyl-[acyl-carrier protein] reductase
LEAPWLRLYAEKSNTESTIQKKYSNIMKLLEGKTTLITGAARGIGRAIALRFAEEGSNIAFTDLAINDDAKAVEKAIKDFGVKGKAYASDASKYDETEKVVNDVIIEFGTIDVLVNNAGITMDTILLRMTEQQWDTVINVNLKSVFNFTKSVQKIMLKNRSGSIINLSSVVGVAGNAGQSNYAASKAGIIGFTKSVAIEFGSRNIRCNALAPGYIITEMTRRLPEEYRRQWENMVPMKRGGTPEEVANAALFLASDLSSYISGQVIHVCGALKT